MIHGTSNIVATKYKWCTSTMVTFHACMPFDALLSSLCGSAWWWHFMHALYSLQWFIDIVRRREIAAWRVNITNMHNYIEGTKGWHAVCCCASIDIRHEGSISYTCIVRQKGQQVWHEHVVVLGYILFWTKKTKGHAAVVLARSVREL